MTNLCHRKLTAARGAFAVGDDKFKVNQTLKAMLDAKVDYYFSLGDVTLGRLLIIFAPVFLPTLEDSGAASGPGGGVERVKAALRWRDEASEAAWMAETGWSLLSLACALDDEAAVTALLAAPEGRSMISSRVRGVKMDTSLRKQPLSVMFLHMAVGLSPLMSAVTFSRPSIVNALLDAGAPMPTGTKLFGDNPCQFRGFFAGKVDNLKLLLHRYPDLACKINQFGTSACHFACMLSTDQGQSDILKE